MTNYREILRLNSLGLNKTQIAEACQCSRTTVIQVFTASKGFRHSVSVTGENVGQGAYGKVVSFVCRKAGFQNARLRVRPQRASKKRSHAEIAVARIL